MIRVARIEEEARTLGLSPAAMAALALALNHVAAGREQIPLEDLVQVETFVRTHIRNQGGQVEKLRADHDVIPEPDPHTVPTDQVLQELRSEETDVERQLEERIRKTHELRAQLTQVEREAFRLRARLYAVEKRGQKLRQIRADADDRAQLDAVIGKLQDGVSRFEAILQAIEERGLMLRLAKLDQEAAR